MLVLSKKLSVPKQAMCSDWRNAASCYVHSNVYHSQCFLSVVLTACVDVQAASGVGGKPNNPSSSNAGGSSLPFNTPVPQISRTNERNTAASPTYSFQPNGNTRPGRIDSPVANRPPSSNFFDYNPPSGMQQSGFNPAPLAPTSAPSGPTSQPAIGRGQDASSFYATPHPAETLSAGYMPPFQAGTVNVQPAPGVSGVAGLMAAAGGNAVQVASGQPGTQPLAGGAVVGASATGPAAGGAPNSTLLVAPEGLGPPVKAGRLSADAASFVPPSIRTAPQGMLLCNQVY